MKLPEELLVASVVRPFYSFFQVPLPRQRGRFQSAYSPKMRSGAIDASRRAP